MTDDHAGGWQHRMSIARVFLALAGLAAMAWAVVVLPVFWSQNVVVAAATAIKSGEAYKPEVLEAIAARIRTDSGAMRRSSNLGKAAIIRLRLAEDSFRAGDTARVDRRLDALSEIIDETFLNAPSDPFLWLVRFWLDSARNGLRPEYLRYLRMSYDLGRYEGWVAVKRNRYALAIFSALPSEMADLAISEFAGFVRWGLVNEAAEIAAGPGRPVRAVLYDRLKDLKPDQRRPFARLMYRRDLDDVLVPGIDPPRPSWR